jgi:hypothetical protein
MKKTTLLLIVLLTIFQAGRAATLRVNNNPGIQAPYTTLNAAYTAAVNGDTIILEASPNNYGALAVSKRLVFVGNGYFTAAYPGTQVNTNNSSVDQLYFFSGSAGSKVFGITFGTVLSIDVQNMVVSRCYISSALSLGSSASNLVVSSNYIAGAFIVNATNTLVTNNIIGNRVDVGSIGLSVSIENNILCWNNGGPVTMNYANNYVTVRNNIFKFSGSLTFSNTNNTVFHNNITSNNALPPGNGNQNAVLMSAVFANPGLVLNDNSAAILPTGSPAIDAGYYGNGDDIGVYNNGTGRPTYIAPSIPPFPTIYTMNIGAVSGNTLQVDVGTRGNN